jgi:sporulation protein YlmC with PRC-barrel domain
MLYRADSIVNQRVEATDGVVGIVRDIYFDDVSWTIRYLVVDTGGWLTRRNVLISSEALIGFNDETSTIATRLSQQQIENSPPSEMGQPISRLNEIQLSQYYGWTPYWTASGGLFPWTQTYRFPRDKKAPETGPASPYFEREFERQSRLEPNLRSFNDLKNYSLRATDGDIGQVEDLLIDPETWQITHLVVDVRLWWPGGLVVIDRAFIEDISWMDENIVVSMSRDQVKKAPPYDKDRPITESYQTELSDYYQDIQSHTQKPMVPPHPWAEVPPQF